MAQHQITINGKKVIAYNDVYTYRGIVELAEMKGTPSVTYRGCYDHNEAKREGIMQPWNQNDREDVVILQDGAIFNVMHTGNA